MVGLSQQLARMHYTDLEHTVSIETLQVGDNWLAFCTAMWWQFGLAMMGAGLMLERPKHVLPSS